MKKTVAKDDWWIDKRSGVGHKVYHVAGSLRQLGEAMCGRYVGPSFGDKKGKGKACETCKTRVKVSSPAVHHGLGKRRTVCSR